MSNVIWAYVNGYGTSYLVSNMGDIIATPRITTRVVNGRLIKQPLKGKTITGHINKSGYRVVALCKNGIDKHHYVHSLVAETFLGPRPIKHHVCHNDGNPCNNKLENLRYDTASGNAADRIKHGTDAIGENNPMSKYSVETIKYIKGELISRTAASIACELGMPKSTVRGIKQGHIWSHI